MLAFLSIATLLNSNIPHDDLISFLHKVESTSSKQYLRYAFILVQELNQKINWNYYTWLSVWSNKWYTIHWSKR